MSNGDYPPQLDTLIAGRYYLQDELGSGGFGYVARARDQQSGRTVAVKFFDTSEEDPKRFAVEVAAMKRVIHPNVVEILESDMQHSPPYCVMPMAECTLGAWADKYRHDKLALLERILQVCEGLQALHAAKLVHRDVKPANMLVLGAKTVICDLGLARVLEDDGSRITRSTTIIGTEVYLSPEQRLPGGSKKADLRSDIYMLGRSVYELLTGHPPAIIAEEHVDGGVLPIIKKATAESPGKRYATVSEFADDLRSYARSIHPNAHADVRARALIKQAKERLAVNEYLSSEVISLMRFWVAIELPAVAIDVWDEIPGGLFYAMVLSDAGLAEQCLRRLLTLFETELDRRSWSYAETVADRMHEMLTADPPDSLWTEAVRVALIAAVKMHRYAAMDTFNNMLVLTKRPTAVASVAAMLREEFTRYTVVAARIQPEELALPIRDVQAKALKAK